MQTSQLGYCLPSLQQCLERLVSNLQIYGGISSCARLSRSWTKPASVFYFSIITYVYTAFIAFSCSINEQECLKGRLLDVPSHMPWPPPFVPSSARASLCILHKQVSTSSQIVEQATVFCMHICYHIAQCSLVHALTIKDAA